MQVCNDLENLWLDFSTGAGYSHIAQAAPNLTKGSTPKKPLLSVFLATALSSELVKRLLALLIERKRLGRTKQTLNIHSIVSDVLQRLV